MATIQGTAVETFIDDVEVFDKSIPKTDVEAYAAQLRQSVPPPRSVVVTGGGQSNWEVRTRWKIV